MTRKTAAKTGEATKTTTTTEEEARALAEEVENMEAELGRLEAEQAQLDAPARVPSWDELQRAGAVEDLENRARRGGVIPRLITAAKVKLLELRAERERLELEPLKAERVRAHDECQEAQAKAREAEQERIATFSRWNSAHAAIQDGERRIRLAEREIREIRELRGGEAS